MRRAHVCPAVVLLLTLATAAQASTLHRLAPSTVAFASDSARYVAWEVVGQKPIFVLDTRTGRRTVIDAPCPLKNWAPAATGRFLLECGTEEEALLDVRTGTTKLFPTAPPHVYAEYGPIWTGVGSRYVIGKGGTSARCQRLHRSEGCLALYNLASGAVTEVAESQVPNPDLPGAPSVCRTLRTRVLELSRADFLEGLGPLSPLEESDFSYSDGLVAEPEGLVRRSIAEPLKHLLVIPCHGKTELVPVHPERRNLGSYPSHLQLSDGVLTWDTGHSSVDYEEGAESSPGEGDLRHGILASYNLHTHNRRSWPLPLLTLNVTRHEVEGNRHVLGTFGYSARTDYEVFWIAARSFSCIYGVTGCAPEGNEVSSIYSARL